MHVQPTNPKRRTKTKCPGVYRSVSGRYEIAFYDSDGRKRFQTIGSSYEEAKAARADVVSKMAKGERVAPTKRTLNEWSEEWIAGLDLRRRTVAQHRHVLRLHILPRFGRRKLADITPHDVARLVADMKRPTQERPKGYAGWTIQGAVATLSACLAAAQWNRLIASNPVRDLPRGKRPKVASPRGKRVLSEDEIRR